MCKKFQTLYGKRIRRDWHSNPNFGKKPPGNLFDIMDSNSFKILDLNTFESGEVSVEFDRLLTTKNNCIIIATDNYKAELMKILV